MLLYSKSHSDEKRSEYVGKCEECGANLYLKGGRLVPNCKVPDGHLCRIKGESDEAGRFS
jgi:hypothetical protein